MADDGRSESASSAGHRPEPGAEPLLPEHASAYFSPRTPPVATAHRTLETELVTFDPSVDPNLADTQRFQGDGLEPPPWSESQTRSDSPTVLVPIVRARRTRRRLASGAAVILIGGSLGVLHGVRSEQGSPAQAYRPVSLSHAIPPTAPVTAPSGPVVISGPARLPSSAGPAVVVEAAPSALHPTPAVSREPRPGSVRAAAPRAGNASPAPVPWFKSERPKAWIP